MEKIINVINGRFGKKVLKNKYRKVWKVFTYGSLFFIFSWLMLKFLSCWGGAVDFLNYVIWG